MTDLFGMEEPDRYDKDIYIFGPEGMRITVFYDDVDHDVILRQTRRVVQLLNEHWGET
jgi:hypothetical protein